MATRTTKAAAAPKSSAVPAASPTDRVTVWVYRRGVAAAGGKTGIVRVSRAVAEGMRAADQAQYMKGDGRLKWREGVVAGYPPVELNPPPPPLPPPPPPPAPAPEPETAPAA